jgi:hypothetical protein
MNTSQKELGAFKKHYNDYECADHTDHSCANLHANSARPHSGLKGKSPYEILREKISPKGVT